MSAEAAIALAKLREVRHALIQSDAPLRINLRDYVPEGSKAWRMFKRTAGVPGLNVRCAAMVSRLDTVIRSLETQQGESVDGAADDPQASGMSLRRLTPMGIKRAQAFLKYMREHADADRRPPKELLYGDTFSRPFDATANIQVEQRRFRTRREAGAYLSPLLAPVRRQVLDDAGVWSWLGIFYFKATAPASLSPTNSTFIFEHGTEDSNAVRSEQQTDRHYLWGSWRLYEQHGESAAFLLDQSISSWDDIAHRSFGSRRVFNSVGVVQSILHLYTNGDRKKRGYGRSPGGLRHLMRVLPQLEMTYDVYGMEPEALLRILPEPFRRWNEGTPRTDRSDTPQKSWRNSA